MSNKHDAQNGDGTLYRTFHCFGRAFPVYYQYSNEDGNTIPGYPDFTIDPQYTEDGRPFALTVQDGCEYARTDTPEEADSCDCGDCQYFRQEAGFSVFGICMNDKRRQSQKETE
jgi:hypothetical protein